MSRGSKLKGVVHRTARISRAVRLIDPATALSVAGLAPHQPILSDVVVISDLSILPIPVSSAWVLRVTCYAHVGAD